MAALAVAVAGGAPAVAEAAPATVVTGPPLAYTCDFALFGQVETTFQFSVHVPENAAGLTTPLDLDTTITGNPAWALAGIERVEGSANLSIGEGTPVHVPLAPLTIPSTSGALVQTGTGQTPPITLPATGTARIELSGVSLSLRPITASGSALALGSTSDSDGDRDTFDVHCSFGLPVVPIIVQFPVGEPSTTAPPTTPTIDYAFAITGAATLKTLVRGTLPLRGGIAAKLAPSTGDFTADLSLQPASAKLSALGFLAVTADVAFVSTAPVTGKLASGALSATAKVRVKLTKVTLFGLTLAGGGTCQTKQPSAIALRSAASFSAIRGGLVTGTFAISDLTGCGSLTGLVSSLTAGKGNVVSLNLTPAT